MLSTKTKEIECLNRLNGSTASFQEIVEFLLEERLINMDTANLVRGSSLPGKELQKVLADLKAKDVLQMLEYEWQVLPKERICLTIVTDLVKKDFTYSSF